MARPRALPWRLALLLLALLLTLSRRPLLTLAAVDSRCAVSASRPLTLWDERLLVTKRRAPGYARGTTLLGRAELLRALTGRVERRVGGSTRGRGREARRATTVRLARGSPRGRRRGRACGRRRSSSSGRGLGRRRLEELVDVDGGLLLRGCGSSGRSSGGGGLLGGSGSSGILGLALDRLTSDTDALRATDGGTVGGGDRAERPDGSLLEVGARLRVVCRRGRERRGRVGNRAETDVGA